MAIKSMGVNSYSRGKPKKSSQGNKKSSISFSTMNKDKKRSYKSYRGQGR